MFIVIKSKGKNIRLKADSIQEYSVDGKSVVTGWYYLTLVIRGKERKFCWDTEEELNKYVEYLDNKLKVEVI